MDHQGHIIVPATVARGLLFISAIILYSLAYDAIDIMDDDNFVTLLASQVQVSVALIAMVKKT